MAFPWGGSLTYSQMAQKFGWPSIIISIILYPALMLFSKLLAFPVWLDMIWEHKQLYVLKTIYSYRDDNFVAKEIYKSHTANGSRGPNGFICLADTEGGVWIESFWGLIHSLKMEVKDDVWIISPHFVSIWPAYVWIEFPAEPPVHDHRVRFYFRLLGPNIINPFMWFSMIFTNSSILWFANLSITPYFNENECVVSNTSLPPAEDPALLREDGSLPFVKTMDPVDEKTPLTV